MTSRTLAPVVFLAATVAFLVAITLAHEERPAPQTPPPGAAATLEPVRPEADIAARPAPSAGPAAGIRLDRGRIQVDVAGMPRAEAASRLALVLGSELHDPQGLLALAPDLHLRWSGTDAREAWRRVLGRVGHSVHCDGRGCRVGISSIDIEGGTVLLPGEAGTPGRDAARAGPSNRPMPADRIDESALQE